MPRYRGSPTRSGGCVSVCTLRLLRRCIIDSRGRACAAPPFYVSISSARRLCTRTRIHARVFTCTHTHTCASSRFRASPSSNIHFVGRATEIISDGRPRMKSQPRKPAPPPLPPVSPVFREGEIFFLIGTTYGSAARLAADEPAKREALRANVDINKFFDERVTDQPRAKRGLRARAQRGEMRESNGGLNTGESAMRNWKFRLYVRKRASSQVEISTPYDFGRRARKIFTRNFSSRKQIDQSQSNARKLLLPATR